MTKYKICFIQGFESLQNAISFANNLVDKYSSHGFDIRILSVKVDENEYGNYSVESDNYSKMPPREFLLEWLQTIIDKYDELLKDLIKENHSVSKKNTNKDLSDYSLYELINLREEFNKKGIDYSLHTNRKELTFLVGDKQIIFHFNTIKVFQS